MSDDEPPRRRIPDPATWELAVNGRLVCQLEQRREADLGTVETAAMVTSLRSLADALETTNLDREASAVLEETDHLLDLHDDDPSNVGNSADE